MFHVKHFLGVKHVTRCELFHVKHFFGVFSILNVSRETLVECETCYTV